MTTTTATQTNSSAIATLVNDFNDAWNQRDLHKLSKCISEDVEYTNPPVRIGFFDIKGEEILGHFKLLKFWEKVFANLSNTEEDKEILEIKNHADGYIVKCHVHNHGLKLSSKLSLHINEEQKINKIIFTKVTTYKGHKGLSVLGMLIKQAKARYFTN